MPNTASKFTLIITQSFLKDLRKISRQDQIRIRKALPEIEIDPYKGRKVIAVDLGKFRWRVGNYRIRYDINGSEVIVLRVFKREDAYRRL